MTEAFRMDVMIHSVYQPGEYWATERQLFYMEGEF